MPNYEQGKGDSEPRRGTGKRGGRRSGRKPNHYKNHPRISGGRHDPSSLPGRKKMLWFCNGDISPDWARVKSGASSRDTWCQEYGPADSFYQNVLLDFIDYPWVFQSEQECVNSGCIHSGAQGLPQYLPSGAVPHTCRTNRDCGNGMVCRGGRCIPQNTPQGDASSCGEWYGLGCGMTAGPFENGNTTSCAPTAMLITRDCVGNSAGCWHACMNNQEDSNCPHCNWNCDGADSWGC
tara:strand:- start:601 stop:1308 length:708 start_codon:yes stop_codon:yes gene_type:complete